MTDEGGTIRDLHNGRVVGKTENLSRSFMEAVTSKGPPCLIVCNTDDRERLEPYAPEWVEWHVDETLHVTWAFDMTLHEWEEGNG